MEPAAPVDDGKDLDELSRGELDILALCHVQGLQITIYLVSGHVSFGFNTDRIELI